MDSTTLKMESEKGTFTNTALPSASGWNTLRARPHGKRNCEAQSTLKRSVRNESTLARQSLILPRSADMCLPAPAITARSIELISLANSARTGLNTVLELA